MAHLLDHFTSHQKVDGVVIRDQDFQTNCRCTHGYPIGRKRPKLKPGAVRLRMFDQPLKSTWLDGRIRAPARSHMDPDPAPSLLLTFFFIFLALFLIALNAFFVAAEFAIVKVRRTRLEELSGQGVGSAKVGLILVDKLDEYLSATQLGITLVSLALGWIGEESFYNLFEILWPNTGGDNSFHHIAAAATSFFIITALHVVLGELVPKSMAIQRSEQITLYIATPLQIFYRVSRPLIHAFSSIANWVLRLIGYGESEEKPLTEEELKMVMRDSKDDGVISDSEAQIINRAFSFSDKRAIDIMIPVEQTQFVSLSRTFEENKAIILSKMHTRFPVCENDMSDVVGILNMKDIRFVNEEDNVIFTRSMRRVMYVYPEMKQDRLMKLFSEKRLHLAVVKDSKTERNMGIVALEDVLEQLVGEIVDEHGN
ncbi:MAG: HlyC/CorC family transporter [Proteobacteria bacterium]|nr:MAG: HlyC/CorC family transporter [Pseudomonadota bacterium]